MSTEIRLIMVEDSADDAELNLLGLQNDGLSVKAVRVATQEEFIEQLHDGHVDIVLSDHSMPQFDAFTALELLRQYDPDIPFILVSGRIGEQRAVELMRAGANDYILKDRLARLPPAVRRELREAETRRRHRRLQSALYMEQRRLGALMSNLPGMVFRLRDGGDFELQFVSRGSVAILGRAPAHLIGRPFGDLVHPDDREAVLARLREATRAKQQFTLDHRVIGANGAVRWVMTRATVTSDDETDKVIIEGYCTDVTEQRKYQEELDFLAHHDTLTGLANRSLFEGQCENLLARAQRESDQVALLFADLDHFKEVNDSWGHQVGDKLLKVVAARINRVVRRSDLVARLGGDEFVVVMPAIKTSQDAAQLSSKLLEAFQEPAQIDGHEIPLSASIGVACFPTDGADVQELLRNADAAMYSAKAAGRRRFRFYAEEMNVRVRQLLAMRSAIPRALENGELELCLQPQVRLNDGAIVGAEALLRWNVPDGRVLAASDIIPIAEELGLIHRVDDWVIEEGCRLIADWTRNGHERLQLSINISAQRFRAPGLVEQVRDALASHQVAADRLVVEITETSLMSEPASALETMSQLTAMGIDLSIDDFGTGYSSLNYLHRFPVRILKMDRSFVERLPDDEDGVRLTSAILALADSLNLAVIAEGVEREEQRASLIRLGCELAQGRLLGKPMKSRKFVALIDRQTSGA